MQVLLDFLIGAYIAQSPIRRQSPFSKTARPSPRLTSPARLDYYRRLIDRGKRMSKKGWLVTAAGLGLNLALGILYAWSMFSKQLTEPVASGGFGWSRTAATLPYTIAIACFALIMVPAGRLQDKLGPRVIATAGASAVQSTALMRDEVLAVSLAGDTLRLDTRWSGAIDYSAVRAVN